MPEDLQYYNYLLSRSWLGYLYRQYWLYPRLTKRLKGLALDVGCGIGDMLAFRAGTIGTDINSRTVDYCLQLGLEAKLMSHDKLPFSSDSFDSVLLDNVIEHIDNPSLLLKEVHRVLKEGGSFLVGVPGDRGWSTDPDHKVAYTEFGLIARIEEAGFKHEESFFTPLGKSRLLNKYFRQYCIYTCYVKRIDRSLN